MNFDSPTQSWIRAAAVALVAVAVGVMVVTQTNHYSALLSLAILFPLSFALLIGATRSSLTILLILNLMFTDVGLLVNTGAETAMSTQALAKAPLYFITILVSTLSIRVNKLHRVDIIPALYLAFCFISIAYSLSPFFSFAASVVLVSQVLLALAIATTASGISDLSWILNAILIALAGKAVISWAIAIAIPSFGFAPMAFASGGSLFGQLPRLSGLAGPNITGFNAALLTILGIARLSESRRVLPALPLFSLPALSIAIGLFTTIATFSRTALLALLFGTLAIFWHRLQRKLPVATLFLVVIAAVFYIGLPSDELLALTSRTGNSEETLTAAGRAELWQNTLLKAQESPLFGFGYGSGRTLVPDFILPGNPRQFYSAHNAWLESLLNLGIAGTIPFAVLMLTPLYYLSIRFHRFNGSKDIGTGCTAIVGLSIAILVNSFAESSAAGIQTIQTLLLFLIFALLFRCWPDKNRAPVVVR